MATTERRDDSLVASLFDEAAGFEFLQAMRLLRDRPLRLRASFDLEFARDEVLSVNPPERDGGPAELTAGVMSLGGPSGPLPAAVSELVLERLHRGDRALSDFLDLFHDRLLELFYLTYEEHRVGLRLDHPEASPFAGDLFALMGLGTTFERHRFRARDAALLPAVGLLLAPAPAAVNLERLVTQLLSRRPNRYDPFPREVSVRVRQFVGQWRAMDPRDRSSIGHTGRNRCLGRDAVLGRSFWDQTAGIGLEVGPVDLPELLHLLPSGGPGHGPLSDVVRFATKDELDVSLEVLLSTEGVEPSRLPAAQRPGEVTPLRLGWTSWLGMPGAGPVSIDLGLLVRS